MPIEPVAERATLLLIGASRGLGLAMAEEFVLQGWNVLGTVRNASAPSLLHDLAAKYPDRIEIETLDICDAAQLNALQQRLQARRFQMLFVNAGATNPDVTQTIGEVSTEDFVQLMITNALSPMRVLEVLQAQVDNDGLLGVMSSGQGSISNNLAGQREVYRGSKAALNMLLRSFAARQAGTARALVAMAPGWVNTALGGAQAPLTIQDSIPSLVQVLLAKRDRPGLEYLDYLGRTVPW